jgi:hypothetical protein
MNGETPALETGDFYWDNGFLVFTEQYHRRRGFCCGNRCRHCPYGHAAVTEDAPDVSG